MADEAAVESTESSETPRGKHRFMTLGIIGGVMLLEGVGIFVAVKMMYHQPAAAVADAPDARDDALAAIEKEVEIVLPEVNAFNKRQGKLMIYNLELAIRVNKEDKERVERILAARQGTILDRLNTVIRSADPKYLSEPGLDTLRRQFKHELTRIMGDSEPISAVLVRRFFQSPVDL